MIWQLLSMRGRLRQELLAAESGQANITSFCGLRRSLVILQSFCRRLCTRKVPGKWLKTEKVCAIIDKVTS